jgi:serine protease Do
MDDAEVKDIGAFRNRVANTAPESETSLTVLRGAERKDVTVRIGTLPGSTDVAATKSEESNSLGIRVQPLTEELAAKLGYADDKGVLVAEVQSGSRAELAGLRKGMLIREVNREQVQSVDDFHRLIKQREGDKSLLLLVKEGKFSRYLALKMES